MGILDKFKAKVLEKVTVDAVVSDLRKTIDLLDSLVHAHSGEADKHSATAQEYEAKAAASKAEAVRGAQVAQNFRKLLGEVQ